jgi:NAD(P)-dependent dehydrogenase (short-subunit alcohol dehydrogenase family)
LLAVTADMMIERTRAHYGRIDILINNAGQGYHAPIEKIDIVTFRYIFDLHVVGPLVAMQQVIPIMRNLGEGSIINISSDTALMELPGMSPYASSKKALAGISLAARQGTAGRGHRGQCGLSVHHPDRL